MAGSRPARSRAHGRPISVISASGKRRSSAFSAGTAQSRSPRKSARKTAIRRGDETIRVSILGALRHDRYGRTPPGTGPELARGGDHLGGGHRADALLLVGADALVADAAGNVVVEDAVRHLPGSPLFRRICQQEKGDH